MNFENFVIPMENLKASINSLQNLICFFENFVNLQMLIVLYFLYSMKGFYLSKLYGMGFIMDLDLKVGN